MRLVLSGLAVLCLTAPNVSAQAAAGANPISDSIRSSWDGAKRNITESAALMTEADYNYKPVDSVRTFGAILAHIAGANYEFCSAVKGEATPHAEEEFEKSAKTKAEITKALADSMTYCDGVYKAATDANLAQKGKGPFGGPEVPHAGPLVSNIGHLNEHYGNLVTYFRMKGIVPPSSRRQ
jgi:hypothetical protein